MNTNVKLGESRFWNPLWAHYGGAPSIALCRVPELEYAATLDVSGKTLDHCCGDGLFAATAWPDRQLTAGCDLDEPALRKARERGNYHRLDHCDVSDRLPYKSESFDLVFNNSALEHVPDVDAALREAARVTRPGGTFAFNVLNHRYFEWWPLDSTSRSAYQEWQPFFHALPLSEWRDRLDRAGFAVQEVRGYFPRKTARLLALLDCEFSGYFLRNRPSKLVSRYQAGYGRLFRWLWRQRLSALPWRTEPEAGAGYFILAKRPV